MATSDDLLRMLEPTVRPVAVPNNGGSRPPQLPLESRSFESLLDQVRNQDPVVGDSAALRRGPGPVERIETGPVEAPPATAQTNLLKGLSNVDAVDNASLRELIPTNWRESAT